jgi:hypothetical protein
MRTPNNPLDRLMSYGAGSYGDFADSISVR